MKKKKIKKDVFPILLVFLFLVLFFGVLSFAFSEKERVLYSYAYTVYLFCLSFVSFPLSYSLYKIVSRYQTAGYYNGKKKIFLFGKLFSLILGIFLFALLFYLAPFLSKGIFGRLGDEKLIFVIRCMASSFLVAPLLWFYRGYFVAHHLNQIVFRSFLVEFVFRIFYIFILSLLSFKIIHLSSSLFVGVTFIGFLCGVLLSYCFLVFEMKNYSMRFRDKIRSVNEPVFNWKKELKGFLYSSLPVSFLIGIPFIYRMIDLFIVTRSLEQSFQYSLSDAKSIFSILSTWTCFFQAILVIVACRVVFYFYKDLVSSKSIKKETILRIFFRLFYFLIPITLGISFLAKPLWLFFYGDSLYGSSILSFSIFDGLFFSIYLVLVFLLFVSKEYRCLLISVFICVAVKLFFDSSFMFAFSRMGLFAYNGTLMASLLGYFISIVYLLIILKKKYSFDMEVILKGWINIIFCSVLTLFVLFLFKLIFPFHSVSRIYSMFYFLIYGILGGFCYSYLASFMGIDSLIFSSKKTLFSKHL